MYIFEVKERERRGEGREIDHRFTSMLIMFNIVAI